MRKAFAVLLSIHLLVMGFAPCGDTVACAEGGHETAEVHCHAAQLPASDPVEGDAHDAEEACSPICYCACCGANVVTPEVLPLLTWAAPIGSQPAFHPTPWTAPAIRPAVEPPEYAVHA